MKAGPPAEWRLPDEFRTDWAELLLSVATSSSPTTGGGDRQRVNG